MKRILSILCAALALTGCVWAQAGGPGNIASTFYAINFAQWTISQGNNGPYSWSNPSTCTSITSGGITFKPFTVGTPIRIVDGASPVNSENVTVQAINVNGSGCNITTSTPAHTHYSFYLTSATQGLQESINYALAQNLQAVVLVTPAWTQAGGSTGTITSAKGSTNVSILDERNAVIVPYTWQSTLYVAQPFGTGSGSVTSFSAPSASWPTWLVPTVTNATTTPSLTVVASAANTSTNGFLTSTDWNTFNSKQAAGNYMTGLTGDVTATGPGSVAATLATVNSGPGSCGDATHVCSITTNGKGLTTAQTPTAITFPGSGISGMTTGQVAIAGSSTTITSSKPLAGSGAGVTTGPTSGVTSGDVISSTGTGGQIQDSGIPTSTLCVTSGTNCPALGTTLTIDSANYATINLAGTACTATPGVIVWHTSLNMTGSSYQLPANCTLQVLAQGALLNLTGSQSLDCSVSFPCITGIPINIGLSNGAGVTGLTGPAPVRWWGATGNGTTDDTAALNNCLNELRSGQCTGLAGDIYKTTSSVIISKPGTGFIGGQGGFTAASNKPTVIAPSFASGDGVSINSGALYSTLRDFSVQRTTLPSGTSRGIACNAAGGLRMTNVQSHDSLSDFYFHGCQSDGTGAVSNLQGANGFLTVTGYTTQTLVAFEYDSEDGVAENSLFVSNTASAVNVASGVTTKDTYIHGAAINDLEIDAPHANANNYGVDILYDGPGTITTATDLHIKHAILETTTSCIRVTNVVAADAAVDFDGGGHCFAITGSTHMFDIESSSGVKIEGMESGTNVNGLVGVLVNGGGSNSFIGNTFPYWNGTTTGTAFQVTNSSGNLFSGVSIKNAATGFNYTGNSSNNVISGGTFGSMTNGSIYAVTNCNNIETGIAYSSVTAHVSGTITCGNNFFSSDGIYVQGVAGITSTTAASFGSGSTVNGSLICTAAGVAGCASGSAIPTTPTNALLKINGSNGSASSITDNGTTIISSEAISFTGGGTLSSGSNTLSFSGAGVGLTGNPFVGASGTATNVANFNSFPFGWNAVYWNGSSSTQDTWTSTNTMGAGTNPTSTLAFAHSGSPGVVVVSVPQLVQTQGDILISSSATPTFNTTYAVNSIILTANVTSSTLAAGNPGQHIALRICQNATGNFTFTAPTNVFGFGTVGATASKCNTQGLDYYTTSAGSGAGWYASGPMVMNQ